MMVPLRVGTEIIEEGKATIPTTIPTIIVGAAAEFSMMRTAALWFNVEHAICGATSLETVHRQMHQSCYVDGVVLEIMKMPTA